MTWPHGAHGKLSHYRRSRPLSTFRPESAERARPPGRAAGVPWVTTKRRPPIVTRRPLRWGRGARLGAVRSACLFGYGKDSTRNRRVTPDVPTRDSSETGTLRGPTGGRSPARHRPGPGGRHKPGRRPERLAPVCNRPAVDRSRHRRAAVAVSSADPVARRWRLGAAAARGQPGPAPR
jgi:hypothetical protein